jgi:hypothetical protein
VPDDSCYYEFFSDVRELAVLGPGYTLYFMFKKAIVWALLVIGILVGVPNINLFYTAYKKNKDNQLFEDSPFFARISIGNILVLDSDEF